MRSYLSFGLLALLVAQGYAQLTLPYSGIDPTATLSSFQISKSGSSGRANTLYITNTSNTSDALLVNTVGTGRAGYFSIVNAASTQPTIRADSNGGGIGVFGFMTGTGRAGAFRVNNAANTSAALFAETNGSGPALSLEAGTGAAANILGLVTINASVNGLHVASGAVRIGQRTSSIGANEVLSVHSPSSGYGGMFVSTGLGGQPYYGYDNQTYTASTTLRADGRFQVIKGGSIALSIGQDNNVGIGVENPQAKVDIQRNTQSGQTGVLHVLNGTASTFDVRRHGIISESRGSGLATGIIGYAKSTSSTSYGTEGLAEGSGYNYGVLGSATGGTVNFAGFFNGQIYASGASSGVKNFRIDHPQDPENKYLEHSSIESDERMNLYRGVVVTDSRGYARIAVPGWFASLNEDFLYQLTVIDTRDSEDFVQAKVVQELDGEQFRIRTSAPRTRVSWQLTGRRHDQTAKYMPLVVERDKLEQERGKYLVPEAFGKDRSYAMVRSSREMAAAERKKR